MCWSTNSAASSADRASIAAMIAWWCARNWVRTCVHSASSPKPQPIGRFIASRIATVRSVTRRLPADRAIVTWNSVSNLLNSSRVRSSSSIRSRAARIAARASSSAWTQANATESRSSTTRTSVTSRPGKLASATCMRSIRVSATCGSPSTIVPPVAPAPTFERSTPFACKVRTASRTTARLTPS